MSEHRELVERALNRVCPHCKAALAPNERVEDCWASPSRAAPDLAPEECPDVFHLRFDGPTGIVPLYRAAPDLARLREQIDEQVRLANEIIDEILEEERAPAKALLAEEGG